MSILDVTNEKVDRWLQPLADPAAPCGTDLEYDNQFLDLNSALAGKPESQFGAGEPPNWRAVAEHSELLFERTRDLRVAVDWARAMVHLNGYIALSAGLQLIVGLMRDHWAHLHPMPDPDDGALYGRANALAVLPEVEGLLGDLRVVRIVADRSIGEVTGRMVEIALGLSSPRPGEPDPGQSTLRQMLADALEREPELGLACQRATQALVDLDALQKTQLAGDGPELKPLRQLVEGVYGLLPKELDSAAAGDEGDGSAEAGAVDHRRRATGLAGEVTSREEAIRAIDMVCTYLERAEPTNPAPLFLRRARQLINHNFLQLVKELAPDSLRDVARAVGIDPDSVETPGSP